MGQTSVYNIPQGKDAPEISVYRNINLGTTGVVAKALPGHIYSWKISNIASTAVYVKIYDSATAPTTSNTPIMTIAFPPNWFDDAVFDKGIPFVNGIAFRASTAPADTDATAPAANQVMINVEYT